MHCLQMMQLNLLILYWHMEALVYNNLWQLLNIMMNLIFSLNLLNHKLDHKMMIEKKWLLPFLITMNL